MNRENSMIVKTSLLIIGAFFLIKALAVSKAFLAPLTFALILALLVLPAVRKMERLIKSRGLSSFLGTLLVLIFSIGILSLASMQIQNFFQDWPLIKEAMAPEIEKLKSFLFQHTSMDEEALKNYSAGTFPFFEEGVNEAAKALSFLKGSLNFLRAYIITFVYTFFLLLYRSHFKEFIVSIVPANTRGRAAEILETSAGKVQDYLVGRLILMAILAVLYSIGLGLSGVNNYILVAAIASILTLIPWVGNIIGFAMATVFGYLTTGDITVLWGIVITFTVSQFFESYILQPYVVGDKVGLHPFFVILFVLLGGAIWGLAGMVLAIPVMAMATVIMKNIGYLRPFGFLFSTKSD